MSMNKAYARSKTTSCCSCLKIHHSVCELSRSVLFRKCSDSSFFGVNSFLFPAENGSFNPSFTKPFGTHTFYQGGRGRPEPPAISKTVEPMNVKFCRALETHLNVLEMLKLFT